MQKQKIKIFKKILLLGIGLITSFTMTFASNFVAGHQTAYAEDPSITCIKTDKDGKITDTQTVKGKECTEGYEQSIDASALTGMSDSEKEEIQKVVSKLLLLEQWLNKLIWPVFMMIGGLLNNELIFTNGMDQRLYDIWVQIRNIVNIVFVMVLVGIALYSVLGISSENSQYSIKTILPKLIVGIIAVNFSFLGIKVILDATTVVTTAIFAIPNQTLGTLQDMKVVDSSNTDVVTELCKKMYGSDGTVDDFNEKINDLMYKNFAATKPGVLNQRAKAADIKAAIEADKEGNLKAEFTDYQKANKPICEVKNKKLVLTTNGEDFLSKFRSNNAALAMAINMGGILFIDRSTGLGTGSDIMQLAIGIVFSFALNVVYMFAFLTLFLVLIARLVVVWISLAFSPIIVLGMTVPGMEKIDMFKKIQDSFVKHVTAPIVIAITMTIGWVMLSALSSLGLETASAPGSVMGMAVPGIPLPGLETMQSLIAAICTAAVVWMGATSAAEGTYVDGVVKSVGGVLTKAGKFIGRAPFMYAPILPIQLKDREGNTRNASLSEAFGGTEDLMTNFRQAQAQKQREFGKQVWGLKDNPSAKDITPDISGGKLAEIIASNGKSDIVEMAKTIKENVKVGQQLYEDLREWKKFPVGSPELIFAQTLDAVKEKGEMTPAQAATLKDAAEQIHKKSQSGAPAASTSSGGAAAGGATGGQGAAGGTNRKPAASNTSVQPPTPLPANLITAAGLTAAAANTDDQDHTKYNALLSAHNATIAVKKDTVEEDITKQAKAAAAAIKEGGFDETNKQAIVGELIKGVAEDKQAAFKTALDAALAESAAGTGTGATGTTGAGTGATAGGGI